MKSSLQALIFANFPSLCRWIGKPQPEYFHDLKLFYTSEELVDYVHAFRND